jgi:hypothetical protein
MRITLKPRPGDGHPGSHSGRFWVAMPVSSSGVPYPELVSMLRLNELRASTPAVACQGDHAGVP